MYKNGLKNGTFKEWFENGKLYSEATYNDNILEDVMKQWYSNGQLRFHNFYNNGKTETEKQALLNKHESTSKFVRQKRDEI